MELVQTTTAKNILDNTQAIMQLADNILLPSQSVLDGWFEQLDYNYKAVFSIRFYIKEIFALEEIEKEKEDKDIALDTLIKNAKSYFYEEKYDENENWWNIKKFQNSILKLTKYLLRNNTYLDDYISPTREMLYEITSQTKCNASFIPMSNLSPFKELLLLEDLVLEECNINSIKNIEHLTYLKVLGIQSNNISSLQPVSYMRNIQWLGASKNNIEDISFIKNLIKLEQLDIRWNNIENIESLKNLKNLKILFCGVNKITSLENIKNLKNLLVIGFSKNKISSIEPLAKLTNLLKILISQNNISDISSIKYHNKIVSFDFRNNQISSLEPILHLQSIRNVGFDGNQISQTQIKQFTTNNPSCFIHTNNSKESL